MSSSKARPNRTWLEAPARDRYSRWRFFCAVARMRAQVSCSLNPRRILRRSNPELSGGVCCAVARKRRSEPSSRQIAEKRLALLVGSQVLREQGKEIRAPLGCTRGLFHVKPGNRTDTPREQAARLLRLELRDHFAGLHVLVVEDNRTDRQRRTQGSCGPWLARGWTCFGRQERLARAIVQVVRQHQIETVAIGG